MKVKARKLKIVYDGGQINGRTRTISRTYSGVGPEAVDQDILAAAKGLAGLQGKKAVEFIKLEEVSLA